jgi:hypothetical protein
MSREREYDGVYSQTVSYRRCSLPVVVSGVDAGAGALGVSSHDEPDPGLPSVDSRPATNTNRPDVTTGYHALAVAERRPRAD